MDKEAVGMQAITVWKDGRYKFWSAADAAYAQNDPDWLSTIPLAQQPAAQAAGPTDEQTDAVISTTMAELRDAGIQTGTVAWEREYARALLSRAAPSGEPVVLRNPYTGELRDIRDVESDPAGTLIVKPGEPLKAAQSASVMAGTKLWLWKNGDHYIAYQHLYPCYSPGGDPMTLGEPCGWAEFRESHDCVAPQPSAQQAEPETVAWRWSENGGKSWFAWTTDWSHYERAKELGCLIEYAAPQPSGEAVLRLLNHIEDVVSDEDWDKIDVTLWNAVTSQYAPQAEQPAEEARGVDEIAAFNAAFERETGIKLCADGTFSSDQDRHSYEIAKWAWQARALLAAPSGEAGYWKREAESWRRACEATEKELRDARNRAAPSGEPVAMVVSQTGNDLRVGWLRPEACKVGDQLYAAPQPSAQQADINATLEELAQTLERHGMKEAARMARGSNPGYPQQAEHPAGEARGVDGGLMEAIRRYAFLFALHTQNNTDASRAEADAALARIRSLLAAPAAGAGQEEPEPAGGWAHALREAQQEIDSMRYQRDAAIQRAEAAEQAATGAQGLTDAAAEARKKALEEAEELCAEVAQSEIANSRAESAAYECVCRIRALAQAAPASLHAESVKENAESLQRGDAASQAAQGEA